MRRSRGERAEELAHHLAFARVDVGEEARAGEIVFVVAEEPFGGRAAVTEGEIGVEQRYAAPALFDERAETLLAMFELGLRLLALRDVAQEGGERLIVAAADAVDRQLDGELLTIRT